MEYQKKPQYRFTLLAAAICFTTLSKQAVAGPDPFVGEISYVGFNFAPKGWAKCDGQLLPVSQYSALYSLLGTAFGGDGRTNFALPDMRGRVPVHQGTGPGLSNYTIGQKGGMETATLNINNLPAHNHTATATSTSTVSGGSISSTLKAVNSDATEKNAQGNALANAAGLNKAYSTTTPDVSMNAGSIDSTLSGLTIGTSTEVTIGPTGGNQPFSIKQPYQVVNCIIALEGTYPSRP